MNIKELKEMITLMNENNLTELEIEKDGMRIKLRKTDTSVSVSPMPVMIEQEKIMHMRPAQGGAPAEQPPTKSVDIKAPMVGTFYRAPSPESAPYVEVGQVLEPGQVICIIEAMKLMNEIKSEIKGKVLEVLVENAEPVEFGQPIFLVEPI